jgi:hypothetical protein
LIKDKKLCGWRWLTSVKKITGKWRRKQAKAVVKKAKNPLFKTSAAVNGMDNVRSGPRYNLGNRNYNRQMSQRSKRRNKKA